MATAAPKPTLHDIAAMPYPASEKAMRQFYDPKWRKYKDGELKTFKVDIRYSYSVEDHFNCEVKAVDLEDAEKMAEDQFDDKCAEPDWVDCEIREMKVQEQSA